MLCLGLDLDQEELTLDRRIRLDLEDVDHVNQLVQLLDDLLNGVPCAIDTNRDDRSIYALRRSDGKALNVEAAPREQTADARQYAWSVLDQDAQCVVSWCCHQTPSSTQSLSQTWSIISWDAAPAGTIG